MEYFSYQIPIARGIEAAMRNKRMALLRAGTGIGKTILALKLAEALQKRLLCVVPKQVITAWRNTASRCNADIIDVINLEQLRINNRPDLVEKRGAQFLWKLDTKNSMVVFDESQSLCGLKTQNAELLASTKQLIKHNSLVELYELPVLLQSATMFPQATLSLRDAVGYRLGFHDRRNGAEWCLRNGAISMQKFQRQFLAMPKNADAALERLNKLLFPAYGVTIDTEQIPGFPKKHLICEEYDIDEDARKEMQHLYQHVADLKAATMERAIKAAWERGFSSAENMEEFVAAQTQFPEELYARAMAELLKVPTLVTLAESHMENNLSVVIFVNFRSLGTFDALAAKLGHHNPALIQGDQTGAERDEHIRRFQRNETRLCIAMSQCGGVGIELDDKVGGHSRVALISPPRSVTQFIQLLGRLVRADTKAEVVTMYIVLAANTLEARIKQKLDLKVNQMDRLQESDLEVFT
jgi:hypothetical protein